MGLRRASRMCRTAEAQPESAKARLWYLYLVMMGCQQSFSIVFPCCPSISIVIDCVITWNTMKVHVHDISWYNDIVILLAMLSFYHVLSMFICHDSWFCDHCRHARAERARANAKDRHFHRQRRAKNFTDEFGIGSFGGLQNAGATNG